MVKALLHLFRSLGRRRGFGVQSPTDYAYLRYVLCESWPYYAYAPLRRNHRKASCRQHRLGRLLFRVANDLQPRQVFLSTGSADALLFDYLRAGCHATRPAVSPADAQLWVVDAVQWHDGRASDSALQCFETGVIPYYVKVVALLHIHSDKSSESLWHRLLDAPHTMSSYDFFNYGVIITGHREQPHHYLVSWLF